MAKNKHPKDPKDTAPDDMALWDRVAGSVKPLKKKSKPAPEAKPAPKVSPRLKNGPAPRPSQKDYAPDTLPELSHGNQPGLDKSTAKRLRRGKAALQGRVDLHGMTQTEARQTLDTFIEAAYFSGKREVLVITGKGTRADGTIGVLREQVPRWLNTAPLRPMVVAFTHAAPKDGGEGALYVRLKKRG